MDRPFLYSEQNNYITNGRENKKFEEVQKLTISNLYIITIYNIEKEIKLFLLPMKIIVAPASFKGSLSNLESARVIKKACLDVFPDADIVFFPVADGGEGTADILKIILGGRFITEKIHNPVFRKIRGRWLKKGGTAYIEMAQAAGLTLLKDRERNPLRTTTYGVGELIKSAVSSGVKEIFIGVGGSATNDGGIGALIALGIRFIGKNQRSIYPGCGKDLADIKKIDASGLMPELQKCRITILSDVKNPLFGKEGAAYIYAPQKGADAYQVRLLDKGLRNYSRVIKMTTGRDISNLSGAGAAGGIVGGFAAFTSVRIVSGINTILQMGRFEEKTRSADLVITGEGKVDAQTSYGKPPAVLAHLCKKHRVPLVILAGNVEEDIYRNHLFQNAVVTSIVPGVVSLKNAMRNAEKYLYYSTVEILKIFKIFYH